MVDYKLKYIKYKRKYLDLDREYRTQLFIVDQPNEINQPSITINQSPVSDFLLIQQPLEINQNPKADSLIIEQPVEIFSIGKKKIELFIY